MRTVGRRSAAASAGLLLSLWLTAPHTGFAWQSEDARQPPGAPPSAESPPTSAQQADLPAPTLAQARELRVEGYYDRALEAYEKLLAAASAPGEVLSATLGICAVLTETGRYREARERLEKLDAPARDATAWDVAVAEVLTVLGEYEGAIEHARRAVARDGKAPGPRLALARLLELTGQRDEAVEAYRWFDRTVTERTELPADAEWLTLVGIGFHRSTVLNETEVARRTKHVLVHFFQAAYERVDRSYWPARIAAAELLRSKYNNDETDGSAGDYQAALRINGKLPEAHVGLGEVALEDWRFEEVERRVRLAREANPEFPPARHLLAKCRILERRYDDAIAAANEALALNERDVTALSLIAAANACKLDQAARDAAIARVERINPRCAFLHRTLGDALSGIRAYAESEKHYLKAIEFDPSDPNPRTELGLMYMQWGYDDRAKTALDGAWALDSFNQRTFNTLELLDSLQAFTRYETEHFIIRYDDRTDPGLGPYLGAYLEEIHPQVCGDYGVTLEEKTIIEVYPSSQAFAVRITGKPWIFTVGACTGRVIALSSPRADVKLAGPYDIANVLKHEFTHTVTLAATENRIPHWFTEGLAVLQEDTPRSFSWCMLLADAIRRDRLFTLESINWGFMRPRRATDRQMAYAQSEWMCEYLIERFGYEVIEKFLAAYKAGKTQEQAFGEILKIEVKAFDQDFRAWARKQAEGWCFDLTPPEGLTLLRTLALVPDDDASVLGRLARAEYEEGNVEEAIAAARKALDKDAGEIRALETLGIILGELAEREPSPQKRQELEGEARGMLERVVAVNPDHVAANRYLGQMAVRRGDLDRAETYFRTLRRVCPIDPAAPAGLAAIYLKRGDREAALGPLLELAAQSEHDSDVPAQIARIFRGKQKFGEALHWYRRAIFADPFSVALHTELAELHLLEGRSAEALTELRMLTRLAPDAAKPWTDAALAAQKLGLTEEATRFAQEAVKRDPSSAAAGLLKTSP